MHISRSPVENRGKLTIELSIKDRNILVAFKDLHSSFYSSITERTRDTNFKDSYKSTTWTIYDLSFREAIVEAGVPVGRKSEIVSLPSCPFSEPDFLRGLIDSDGSVGYTGGGWPFLSLNTSSDEIAIAYQGFLLRTIGKTRKNKRNARDNTYNIVITKEDAQAVCKLLYYPGCLALRRKQDKADKIQKWRRPANMKTRPPRKNWSYNEDLIVMSHTTADAAKILNEQLKALSSGHGDLTAARRDRMHRFGYLISYTVKHNCQYPDPGTGYYLCKQPARFEIQASDFITNIDAKFHRHSCGDHVLSIKEIGDVITEVSCPPETCVQCDDWTFRIG